MSADAAFVPQVIQGGRFDARAMADKFWAEGNYEAANEMGRLAPDDPSRVCRLTGRPAQGYARVPGTDGDADVAISHGRHDGYPTPLQRWLGGWVDKQGNRRDPERPVMRVTRASDRLVLVLARTDNGPSQGGEALAAVLGIDGPGVLVKTEYAPDGTPMFYRHVAPGPGVVPAPTPVEG